MSTFSEIRLSPLMLASQYLKSRGWQVEKVADTEISTEINQFFTPFHLCMMWHEEQQSLMVSCHIRQDITDKTHLAVVELLANLNSTIWMGHYEMAPEDGLVGYRYTLNLADVKYPTDAQLESMIDTAIAECVRIYPALQYILVEGKTAKEAALAAMMDTVGEA
jgi:hypothetical protein